MRMIIIMMMILMMTWRVCKSTDAHVKRSDEISSDFVDAVKRSTTCEPCGTASFCCRVRKRRTVDVDIDHHANHTGLVMTYLFMTYGLVLSVFVILVSFLRILAPACA